jgi:hypothetical protein
MIASQTKIRPHIERETVKEREKRLQTLPLSLPLLGR